MGSGQPAAQLFVLLFPMDRSYQRGLLIWEILVVGGAAGPPGIQEYLSGPVLEAWLEV